VGDELMIAPTNGPTKWKHYAQFETVRIVAISGRKIRVHRPLTYNHPALTVRTGMVFGPEIANLTRSVRIEGMPGKRAQALSSFVNRSNFLSSISSAASLPLFSG